MTLRYSTHQSTSGMNYYLPCFQKSSQTDEQEPLLPTQKHPSRQPGITAVDKIVDILAAFNSGKLPSQTQLSRFLQKLLSSSLLKPDGDNSISTRAHGPRSKEGRKVLNDVRTLVQAILQFGLEKNGKISFFSSFQLGSCIYDR